MAIQLTVILCITVGFCGIVALILYHVKRIHLYRTAAKLPGPPALPFIGNGHLFVGNSEDILNKMTNLMDSYPSPFRLWIAHRLMIALYDAEHIKTVFLSPVSIEKDMVYDFGRYWVGTGRLTAPETAMGINLNTQTRTNTRYVSSHNRVEETCYLRAHKIWLYPDFIFNRTKLGKDHRKCADYLHTVTNSVIDKKKYSYKNSCQVVNEEAATEQKPRKVFLDLLMEMVKDGTKLIDQDIRDEVNTIMSAGISTTVTAGSFAMVMLASFPEIQSNVFLNLVIHSNKMAIQLTVILCITVGFCGIIALILYHVKRIHLYRASAKLPGPPAFPFIGNGHITLGNSEDILDKMINLMDSYPSPFRLWAGQRLMIVLYDAEHIKTVLLNRESIEKDMVYDLGRYWVGTGLLSAPAVKWRIHRKLINPAFHQKVVESFVQIFAKQWEIFTKCLRKELDKDEFDISQYATLCNMDIICETAMGIKLNTQTGNYATYVSAHNRVEETFFLRTHKVWLYPDFIFNRTKLGKDHRKGVDCLHTVTNSVIDKKKSSYKNSYRVVNEEAATEKKPRKAFLDLLMEMVKDGTKLTDQDIRDEVNTMMSAGISTTVSAGSFAMVMLASFPEIQEKAYRELYEIYGDEISSDTPVQYEDLNRMKYLERIIKESMRVFPPVPLVARRLTGDINIGDHVIPKGSSVIIEILKLHRLEKYWHDPLKFDPDRFLPEEVAKRHPYCYIPFIFGIRNCIGQSFAMMSMKTMLATVLRRYVLKKDKVVNIEDMKLKAETVLKSTEPLTIRIIERAVEPKVKIK